MANEKMTSSDDMLHQLKMDMGNSKIKWIEIGGCKYSANDGRGIFEAVRDVLFHKKSQSAPLSFQYDIPNGIVCYNRIKD